MKTPSARPPSFGKKPGGFGKRKASFGEGEGPRVERATIGFGKKKAFGGKKPFGEKKPFGKKPEGSFSRDRDDSPRKPRAAGDRPERSFSDRPQRSSGDRPERSDRPQRSFGDRPERSDRPQRSFGDRPERSDRPQRSFGDRPERSDRPQRSFGDRPERSDRPQRSFGDRPERSDRPRRDRDEGFNKSPRPFGKKPFGERSFDKGPRPERSFKSDRPRRESLPALETNPNGILLWGTHAVREALLNPQRNCHTLWVTDSGRAAIAETLEEAAKAGLTRPEPIRVEKEAIEKLLPRSSVHQGIVLDTSPLTEMSLDDLLGLDNGPEIVVILDQVTDPHNVGAIMRSAAAFGAGAVIVTERNAPGTTGTLAKTACGACEHVPLISVVNLARSLEMLKAENFWIIGLAEEGEKDLCGSALSSGRIALVMGAEGEGLRRLTRENCDELARLPTGGAIGSLNVSNAAAVSLYEARRQRKAQ